MITVQFKSKIKNGVIRVPKKYHIQFKDDVHVTLKVENRKSKSRNYLDELITCPVIVKNFHPILSAQVYAKT